MNTILVQLLESNRRVNAPQLELSNILLLFHVQSIKPYGILFSEDFVKEHDVSGCLVELPQVLLIHVHHQQTS